MLEARLQDENGNEVEGYFWYADDSEYALAESFKRAEEEGIECSSIHIYTENGEHIALACV